MTISADLYTLAERARVQALLTSTWGAAPLSIVTTTGFCQPAVPVVEMKSCDMGGVGKGAADADNDIADASKRTTGNFGIWHLADCSGSL